MHGAREFLLVAAGGAGGAVARWLLSEGLRTRTGAAFPWPTLVVNLLGCLALGLVLTLVKVRPSGAGVWVPLCAVGFLGAFTTFSTFSWETHELLEKSDGMRAAAYAAGSVLLGLGAVRLGIGAARALSAAG